MRSPGCAAPPRSPWMPTPAAMRACRAGRHEYEIEALIDYIFRRNDGLPGYGSIIGGGANATILHYVDNRDVLRAGEVLLADAGCEWQGFTADITPATPSPSQVVRAFQPAQRRLYEAVLAAQLAGIADASRVRRLRRFTKPAPATLTQSLVELGLLHGTVDDLIASGAREALPAPHQPLAGHGCPRRRHLLSRQSRAGSCRHGADHRGPACTSAPTTPTVRRVRGIGIRIEDDVLITDTATRSSPEALPKQPGEIEALAGTGITFVL